MKQVSIVGFGRFGETLYRLIRDDFIVTIFDLKTIDAEKITSKNTIIAKTIEEVYRSEAIFYCIPISSFEKVILEHKKYFKPKKVKFSTRTLDVVTTLIMMAVTFIGAIYWLSAQVPSELVIG